MAQESRYPKEDQKEDLFRKELLQEDKQVDNQVLMGQYKE
jgi:hypothetical protein